MPKKISLRLPNDIYETLQREALQARIPISAVARERLLQSRNIDSLYPQTISLDPNIQKQISEILNLISEKKSPGGEDPALVEMLFLLRELFLQRDGGIIRKVDAMLDRRFGKERVKIL